MWFIHFIPLETSLLLCCVAIHNKTTTFLPSSFLSAKSHCLVAKCRNQSKSLRRHVASTFLDQEPPVLCCIGSSDILSSSGFFQAFSMSLLLCPYFSELWAFYSHRGSSVQVDECVITGWPPEPHPRNTSVWLFACDPKGFSYVTLFSSPWVLFLCVRFWVGFLIWEILEVVKIHNFVTSHFNFTTG